MKESGVHGSFYREMPVERLYRSCRHAKIQPRRLPSNNSVVLQCQVCGRNVSGALPHRFFRVDELPAFDVDLRQSCLKAHLEARASAPGIPTVYAGRQFRSILEARWAAFFDLCDWRWEYEPYELNGWIPDFVILPTRRGPKDGHFVVDVAPVLVEVKPFTTLEEFDVQKIDKATVTTHAESFEVLLLGATIHWGNDHANLSVGWLGDCPWAGRAFEVVSKRRSYARANLVMNGGDLGFCHELNWFFNRINGVYVGGGGDGLWDEEKARMISGWWQEAGNSAQWRRP